MSNNYNYLGKDDISKVEDCNTEIFEVEEWNGYIVLSPMTINQRAEFDAEYLTAESKFKDLKDPNVIYDMLSYCISDMDGNRLYNKDEARKEFSNKNAKVLYRIFYKCMSMNYLDEESNAIVKKN